MNLLNFIQQYPDKQTCIARFKVQCDQNGVVCPKCGFREHFRLKNKLRNVMGKRDNRYQLSGQDDPTTSKKLNEVVQLDMHHQLKNEYLQYYPDEFSYKFNRRYFGGKLFDQLVMVATSYSTDFESGIYNRMLCG